MEPIRALPPEQCQAILAEAIAFEVRNRGAAALGGGPYMVTLEYGRPPNHILHLLISFFTCGLWLPVWLLLAMTSHTSRRILRVDEYGQLWWV
ncbi:hypothetical protein C8259_34405 [Nocardia nova]|uniref:Uncharacterized protein n=1 Tax=Nocardia nova TaxID=37330 RepID=A0A2T2YPY8_9NOCA|nr:hypothetical protein C8259_34405 [Nocardia nova]